MPEQFLSFVSYIYFHSESLLLSVWYLHLFCFVLYFVSYSKFRKYHYAGIEP